MQEKPLVDFMKEAAISPTAEELLRDLRVEPDDAPRQLPETVLVILDQA